MHSLFFLTTITELKYWSLNNVKRNVCCTFKWKKRAAVTKQKLDSSYRELAQHLSCRGLVFAIPSHSGQRSWTRIKHNSNTILPPLLPHSLSQMSWTAQWLMELVVNLPSQSAVVMPLSWRWTFTFGSHRLLKQLNFAIATTSSATILRHILTWSLSFGHGDPPSQTLQTANPYQTWHPSQVPW